MHNTSTVVAPRGRVRVQSRVKSALPSLFTQVHTSDGFNTLCFHDEEKHRENTFLSEKVRILQKDVKSLNLAIWSAWKNYLDPVPTPVKGI